MQNTFAFSCTVIIRHYGRAALAPNALQLLPLDPHPTDIFMSVSATDNQDVDLFLVHNQSPVKMAPGMAHDIESSALAGFAERLRRGLVALLPIRCVVVCDSAVPDCPLAWFAVLISCS